MHWIVQSNVFNEERYETVISTLRNAEIPFTEVKVVPFSHELIPHPDVTNPIAVIGSYGLVKKAKELGWGPGVFLNDQIDYAVYGDKFGDDLLNYGAIQTTFGQVKMTEPMFIRPTCDGKAFAGDVFLPEAFEIWRDQILSVGETSISMDLPVVVSPARKIHAEYRFFVVDGWIVGKSRYRVHGRLWPSEDVPDYLIKHVYKFINIWSPDRAFVIDLAETPEGIKIVEFNNINAAGWYKADVSRIIQAIDLIE